MNRYQMRHHFRLDPATEQALEEIVRHTFSSKSSLMRRYVQEGVARDAQIYAQTAEQVLRSTRILKSV